MQPKPAPAKQHPVTGDDGHLSDTFIVIATKQPVDCVHEHCVCIAVRAGKGHHDAVAELISQCRMPMIDSDDDERFRGTLVGPKACSGESSVQRWEAKLAAHVVDIDEHDADGCVRDGCAGARHFLRFSWKRSAQSGPF